MGFELDLVEMCAALSGLGPIALFVDHGPRPCAIETVPGVIVLFAGKKNGPFSTADDMIVSTVGRLSKLSTILTVVTGDRALSRRCRFAALRTPESRLRIVPSQQLADWLFDQAGNTEFCGSHPFETNKRTLSKEKDEWLQGIPTAGNTQNRPNWHRERLIEGTPIRVRMAIGLYIRIESWWQQKESKKQNHISSLQNWTGKTGIIASSKTMTPRWIQTLLERHPWRSDLGAKNKNFYRS